VVDGLVRAVDEACDPLARQLEMYPTTDGPIAPIVLAQGLRTVHATSKYNTPKPAELREAIVTAHWRFRKMLKALDRAEEHRSNIDALIREHAPEQIEHHTTSRVVERRAAACRVRSDVVKG
jgi:hypothetical protein